VPRYRHALPQLGGNLFLTDGGIETTLAFHEGFELPDFAAFHLLKDSKGEAGLRKYFRTYAAIAMRWHTGLILESATWRASSDWGQKLGYTREALADVGRRAVHLLEEIRGEFECEQTPIVISGCVGPRRDGYDRAWTMSEKEAETYHCEQVHDFGETAADMVCAMTMSYVEEAAGITRAARAAGMPVAISFTVETDGKLPSGQTVKAAIEQVDRTTSGYPCYYMINCAHPDHFEHVLGEGDQTLQRIRGLRANASRRSHAEMNEASDLDVGNPSEFGVQYARLRSRLKQLNVMGGCCGTDHRHIEQIAEACVPLFVIAP